jgi:hypothetical protein
LLAALAVFCSIGAATAHADVFCLNSPTCGLAGSNYPMTRDGLAAALLDAQNTPEESTIEIGSGTIVIDTPIAVAASATNRVSIEGVGTSGRPLLHFTHPTLYGLTFTGSGASPGGLSYVDVQIDAVNASRAALSVQDGRIFDVNFDVTASGGFGTTGAVLTSGAECAFCDFSIIGTGASGVSTTGAATVKRSTFTGDKNAVDTTAGVAAQPGSSVTVSTSRFAYLATALRIQAGTVNMNDSVIDLGIRSGARGVDLDNPSASGSGSIASSLDGVTVVGTGQSQFGLRVAAATTSGTPENATGSAKNSLFMMTGGAAADVFCSQGTNASSQINATYSKIGLSSPLVTGGCGVLDANNIKSDTLTPDQLFVDAAAGNYRLKKGAAVIDQGVDAADASLIGRVLDAYTLHRVVGSNIDMGGSEYENLAPTKPTLTPSTATTVVGTPVQLSAESTDPNGDPVTYDWNFGDGTVGSGASTSHSFAQPGTFAVSVAASDFDLQGPAADASITVTVVPPPSTGGGDETPLSFSFTKPKCKFKPSTKSKNGFTAHAAKIKDCYLQSFSSAEHSYMFRLERTGAGFLVGSTCKAKQGKTGKASKRCNLPLKGTQEIKLPAGTSFLSFGGRWNKKQLPPGTYTLKSGINGINPNGMPNRISMNLTVAKQGSSGRTK